MRKLLEALKARQTMFESVISASQGGKVVLLDGETIRLMKLHHADSKKIILELEQNLRDGKYHYGDAPEHKPEHKEVTKDDFMLAADKGYGPDGLVYRYYEDPEGHHGDGLAAFVAAEVATSFDESGELEEKLQWALSRLEKAVDELRGVMHVLNAKYEGR